MATVYFMRDGDVPNRAKRVGDVFIGTAIDHFGHHERQYSVDSPSIGQDAQVTECADYRYVVVRIDDAEICPAFSMAGYYLIKDLSVSMASSLLGLDVPQ